MNAIEDRARSIFLTALEREPSEWPALLAEACGPDAPLQARVEQLLEAHRAMGSIHRRAEFLPESQFEDLDKAIGIRPGEVVGPYKLLEQIGEGGFGVVYMAEQTKPVRRKVAVKVLKPGMDSRHVIARFEAERQALALMDHAHIAKVLEAGETNDGRPYFAMELVRGVPITEYCDKNHLPPRARLELFLTVCQAVQHAHHKGIIHRDLKPSNVLVTLHDGNPVVKVIDFGIAKALGQQLTDKTLFTGFAQLVGTPLYMSPEQAEMSGLDVDTRSDLYSLGVLLYELLTGTTPFDKDRFTGASYDEMRRIIREEEPASPSTRLNTMGAAATVISAHRQSDPRQLSRFFRGELDWIVMRALEKERGRRYETADAFAADVQRFLHNEPVSACPPSALYRLGKAARRHRWAVAMGSVIAAALVVIAIGSLAAALMLNQALRDSDSNRQRAEGAEKAANAAEKAAIERLYGSLVAQARATRLSRRMGQRFDSMAAIEEAAKISRDLGTLRASALELRNEVIACLSLADLRVAKEWDGWPTDSLTVNFDGALERYARVDRQGIVHLHRVADGVEFARLEAFGPSHAGPTQPNPEFSPDGRFLLLTRRKDVKLWRLAGDVPMPIALPPIAWIGSAFSPDSREIVLEDAAGVLHVHDLPSGRELNRIGQAPTCRYLAYHPQHRQLAISHSAGVQIRDLDTGDILAELAQPAGCGYIAWHPNGKVLAIGGDDRVIQLWDIAIRKPCVRLEGPKISGYWFAFKRSGDLIAGTGWDDMLRLWDTQTGRELFNTRTPVPSLRFSTDDRLLAAGFDNDTKKLRLWEIAAPLSYRVLTRAPIRDREGYGGCAVRARDGLLAVGTWHGVGLWHMKSGAQLAFLDLGVGSGCNFEPDGSLLTWEPNMRWPIQGDLNTPGRLQIGPPEYLPFAPGATVVSQDGSVMAIAGSRFRGSRGLVWHRDQPTKLIQLPYHEDPRHIDISPDGRWVATGSHWGTKVRISDARTGQLSHELPAEGTSVVCFSPNGRWLATSGGACRLWEVPSWRAGFSCAGQPLAFSPDSKMLAVESSNRTVRLIDPETGREFAQLESPGPPGVYRACFTADGAQFIACNPDGNHVQSWDLRRIQSELVKLGLEWDASAYPPPPARAAISAFDIQVKLGDVLNRKLALPKNDEAWALATTPSLEARDPFRAVALAKETVAMLPEDANCWNTLGVAHYRARQWDAAIAALKTSMRLGPGVQEGFNTFFLAMAYWQRKEPEHARKWYEQAVTWLEENQANLRKEEQEELRRFHDEAAALLKSK